MTHSLATSFIPALLVGLALALVGRLTQGPWRTALQWAGFLIAFVPQALIWFLEERSADLIIDEDAIRSLWMLGGSALALWKLRRAWSTGRQPADSKGPTRSPWNLLVFSLLLAGLGAFCGERFLEDALLPHRVIEGRVQTIKTLVRRTRPDQSRIYIDGQAYPITRDLLVQVHAGDRIRVEAAAGSKYVLRVEHLGQQ